MRGTAGPPLATMDGPGRPSVAAVHGPRGHVTARTTYGVTDLLALSMQVRHRDIYGATCARHIGPGNSSYEGIPLSPWKLQFLCQSF